MGQVTVEFSGLSGCAHYLSKMNGALIETLQYTTAVAEEMLSCEPVSFTTENEDTVINKAKVQILMSSFATMFSSFKPTSR